MPDPAAAVPFTRGALRRIWTRPAGARPETASPESPAAILADMAALRDTLALAEALQRVTGEEAQTLATRDARDGSFNAEAKAAEVTAAIKTALAALESRARATRFAPGEGGAA